MSATAPPTDSSVRNFSSPVRITTTAVELRDRSLPLDSIKSSEVVKVIPGKQPWEHWLSLIVAIGLFLGVRYLLRQEVWQFDTLRRVLFEVSIATLAVLVVAAILRWFYSRTSKSWRTFYVPRMYTAEGLVTLAAFEDEQLARGMVAAIEEARARRASSTRLEPETLYELDSVVHISHEGVAINGGPLIPAERLRLAYKGKIEVKQTTGIRSSLKQAIGIGFILGLIAVVGEPLKPIIDAIGPYAAALFWGLIGIALLYVFIKWLRDEQRLQSLDEIYMCRLRTDYDEFDVLLTPDKWYIDTVMAAINSLVPRPDNRNRRTA